MSVWGEKKKGNIHRKVALKLLFEPRNFHLFHVQHLGTAGLERPGSVRRRRPCPEGLGFPWLARQRQQSADKSSLSRLSLEQTSHSLISMAPDHCRNLPATGGSWGDCTAPLPDGARRRAAPMEVNTSSTISLHGAGTAPNTFAMHKLGDTGQEAAQGLSVRG